MTDCEQMWTDYQGLFPPLFDRIPKRATLMGMTFKILEFLGFQAVWFSCVLGAARGLPWLGPVVGLVFLGLRALACRPAGPWLGLVLLSGAIGYVLDSLLVLSGALTFPPRTALGAPSTLWMVMLWMAFAATLRGSFAWIQGRYGTAVVLGLVFGPLSYFAGERFGAVEFSRGPLFALIGVGLVWGAAMPLLVWLEKRLAPRDVD